MEGNTQGSKVPVWEFWSKKRYTTKKLNTKKLMEKHLEHFRFELPSFTDFLVHGWKLPAEILWWKKPVPTRVDSNLWQMEHHFPFASDKMKKLISSGAFAQKTSSQQEKGVQRRKRRMLFWKRAGEGNAVSCRQTRPTSPEHAIMSYHKILFDSTMTPVPCPLQSSTPVLKINTKNWKGIFQNNTILNSASVSQCTKAQFPRWN